LRTGPLVQRGAKVSRATQISSAPTRLSPSHRLLNRTFSSLSEPSAKTTLKSSNLHLECRLPISLREYLADELGAIVDAADDNVLNLAANADAATLSKLARAIRRYSTSRAQQTWESCHASLADFIIGAGTEPPMVALCLKCGRIEMGEGSLASHQTGGCVSLSLQDACKSSRGRSVRATETQVADVIRRSIEEFRRLRAAFGLSHFDLDSYTHHGRITFTWRPLV